MPNNPTPQSTTKTPKLRFPEFKDAWVEKKVEEVFELTRGTVLSMLEVKESPDLDYKYPVYSSQTRNKGLAGYYKAYLFEDCLTWTTDGAGAGDVNFRTGKFYCTNVCGILKNADGECNQFTAELLNSVSRKYVSYVGNPKLMNNVMAKISIPLPSLPEQTKIAEFLTAVDDKITLLDNQKKQLEQYKKGLLQAMFTSSNNRGGGNTIRFLDVGGISFPDWAEMRISDLINDKIIFKPLDGNHGNIHPISSDYVKNGIPFIMANDISNGMINILGSKKISKIQADSLQKGFSLTGDVLITHKGSVGVTAIVSDLETDYIMLTPQVTYYRVKDKSLLFNKFLKVTFDSPNFQKNLHTLASGGTRPYVGITEQQSLSISLPTLPEQTKIADFLTSIDDNIEVVGDQMTATKLWKKGLLQAMMV